MCPKIRVRAANNTNNKRSTTVGVLSVSICCSLVAVVLSTVHAVVRPWRNYQTVASRRRWGNEERSLSYADNVISALIAVIRCRLSITLTITTLLLLLPLQLRSITAAYYRVCDACDARGAPVGSRTKPPRGHQSEVRMDSLTSSLPGARRPSRTPGHTDDGWIVETQK